MIFSTYVSLKNGNERSKLHFVVVFLICGATLFLLLASCNFFIFLADTFRHIQGFFVHS